MTGVTEWARGDLVVEELKDAPLVALPTGGLLVGRRELIECLRSRRDEIEAAVMTRAVSVSEPVGRDPDYLSGLRAAVTAAIEHGLSALERDLSRESAVPMALLAQARLAASVGVPLATVLRRYFAGYTLLLDFIFAESRRLGHLDGAEIQEMLRREGLAHENVVAAITDEYAREVKELQRRRPGRRQQIVRRLLAGEALDASALGYEFEGLFHQALIMRGRAGDRMTQGLVGHGMYRRLSIVGGKDEVFLWLAAGDPIDSRALAEEVLRKATDDQIVALGESAPGLGGWRLTHRQARAAMAVGQAHDSPVVRYADVALSASLLQDDLLAESLRVLYLEPLAADECGGEAPHEILEAYFEAGRNVSSAAAALGLNRRTVAKRLQAIDDCLDGALRHRAADLEVALRLAEIDRARKSNGRP
jgi:PucR C-terminal helix-turn-helix domain